MDAYINQIATAVPPYDIHGKFVDYVMSMLREVRGRTLFKRMASRAEIEHRYSFFPPHHEATHLETLDFYKPGDFPNTEARMKFYEQHAFGLASQALDRLFGSKEKNDITHLLITTCTGFYAPGLDLQIIKHYGLNASIERTIIGFMGCYAGINALKVAHHIVRSKSNAKVLIINLELCTLHLQESQDLEQVLGFLVFADGCAASLVSAEPTGIRINDFYCALIPDSAEQITWHIGSSGFDMLLSGQVPAAITNSLPPCIDKILNNVPREKIRHWAIHPGGRRILDAVQETIGIADEQLEPSRNVLRDYGNTSSASIMFVLKAVLERGDKGLGCAMAFGPGLGVESMSFEVTGASP